MRFHTKLNSIKALSLLLCSQLFLAGCQTDSTDLVDPPEFYQAVQTEGDGISVDFNPKVDILFVIDDSKSMQVHQDRLVQNIDKFVDAFAQFDVIDFHIGAITVWDSQRYQSQDNPTGVVPAVSPSDGFVNFYPKGQLHPLKAPEGQEALLSQLQGQNYVSRTEGYSEILRQTLLSIVPKCHESYRDCLTLEQKAAGEGRGPEYEEHFSPLISALSDSTLIQGANQGFRRSDAHLVVIFISDADDGTINVSSSQMAAFLRDITGSRQEQNFSVYGVIHPPSLQSTESCKKDPSGPADKLSEFFRLTRAESLNICSNDYGTLLSNIGNQIRRKAFAAVVYLPLLPEYYIENETYIETKTELTEDGEEKEIAVTEQREVLKWIEVRYGDQLVPNDPETGWTYDANRNAIILHEGLEIKAEEGARLSITYTPVETRNGQSGRTQRYWQ